MKRWLIALLLLIIPVIALANWMYLPGPGYSLAVGGGIALLDDFNRSDGGLGTNWTTNVGQTAPSIVSFQVKGTSAARYGAYWNADTFIDDQKACLDITTANSNAVAVRISPSAQSMYIFGVFDAGTFQLKKLINGSYSTIATYSSASSSTVCLAVSGSTLTPSINGVDQTSQTDTSLSSGSPGIFMYGSAAYVDNFMAGNL